VNQDWRVHAACRGKDPALFFPDLGRGRALYNRRVREAQRICLECPVISECLRYALVSNASYGVWGGTSELDRAHLNGRGRVY
jgi:WhiB family redox-sensing transcriptional regulator